MALFPKTPNTATNAFTAVVTIVTDSQEHAEQVLGERLLHDEDYGFDYTVNYTEPQSQETVRGITLDASVVRDEINDFIENTHCPDTLFAMDAELIRERVQDLSDDRINTIISHLDSSAVWDAFDTMRSQAATAVINTVIFRWTADDEARLRLLESYGDALTDDETDEINDLMWRYANSHWGLETLTDPVETNI